MIVDPDFPDHWKVQMLAGMLGDDPAAPVYLLRLWGHCQNRKKDRFDNLPAMALRAICKYPGDAGEFEAALTECGFVERDDDELIVVGWADHNANLLKSWENGKRGGRPKKPTENPRVNQPENPRETNGSPDEVDEVDREDKEDEVEEKNRAPTRPDFISPDLWNEYRRYRTSKKATLTPRAWGQIEKQLREGMGRGHDPEDMLAEAMAAGWQGFQLHWYENRMGGKSGAKGDWLSQFMAEQEQQFRGCR